MRISSKDIWNPEEFSVLRDKIVEDLTPILPEMAAKLNYQETAILDNIRSQIRRRIEKSTAMKPVTFVHFYKLPLHEAVNQGNDIDPNQPLIIYPSSEID